MKNIKKITCFILTLVMVFLMVCPTMAKEGSDAKSNISTIVKYVKKKGKSTSGGNKYVTCNWDKHNNHGYTTQLIYISKSNMGKNYI